jgi:L,D-transpeptidase YcbB
LLGGGSLAALLAFGHIATAQDAGAPPAGGLPAAGPTQTFATQPASGAPAALQRRETPPPLSPTPAAPAASSVAASAPVPAPAPAPAPASAPASSPVPAQGSVSAPASTAAAAAPNAPLAAAASPLQQAMDAFVSAPDARGKISAERKRRREAIAAFYAARDDRPMWLDGDRWTAGAKAVVDRLEHADADGLSSADFPLPALASGAAATQAAAELTLTDAVVVFGEEASGGRIDPRRISPSIADPHTRLEPAEILTRIAAADPAQTLDSFDPPQAGFRALRDRLAQLRASHPDAAALRMPGGRTLRIGMRDARAPILRERLGLVPATGDDANIYDAELAAAVADFQRGAGLKADGVFTPRTAAAMSGTGGGARQEAEIVANMELWRWSPRDMGADRIEVNIPDFGLTMFRDGKAVRHARVVVGKATSPTPLFSDAIRFVVVNPSWAVPPSIVKKEMLPKYAADPNYFAENGYVVTRKGDSLEVRQPPGDRNALGRIKFLFPNGWDVYLHDTPERALFSAAVRDFSHGCVRVQDPFALGQDVLGGQWDENRLKKLIGDRERIIRMPTPLPIHIEYFTAWIDDAGKLETRPDVYGYEHKIERALGVVG